MNIVTSECMQTASVMGEALNASNITVLNLFLSVVRMFSYRYKYFLMLNQEDPQVRINIAKEFLMQYNGDNE